MKRILFFLVALLPMMVTAQTLTTYTAASWQGEWQSIASTGTLLASVTGDYGTQTLAMPFNFMYGQSDYQAGTIMTVRADGFVVLRGSSGGHNAIGYWNQPSYSIISPFPLLDGQLPAGQSGCWYQVLTDENGEQMLVIEWNGLQRYPSYPITPAEASQDNFNYQLRLHENGDISAVYGHMHSGVASDSLFNFIMTDGATIMGSYMDQVSLRGTWDSVIAQSNATPGYRQNNRWVILPYSNLAGVPDSGMVVTWYRPLPPCPRPTAIAVSAVGHDTALLSWTPNEVADSYVRIQFDTVDFTPGTPGHHLLLYGGDTCHLQGLTPNHQHWLYMRSDCGADSSEWHGVQFSTPCTPLSHGDLPLAEDFESRPDNDPTLWDGCWKAGSNVSVRDISAMDGRPNIALRVNNIGWFHLPPVDSVRTTRLRFLAHGPYGGSSNPTVTLQVGVMEDPFNINSLEVLQTFTLNHNSWVEYTVPMATYSGNGNTVAFKWTTSSQLFIDDIVLEAFDQCLPVNQVTASEVGQHTAEIGWSVYAPATSYRVTWHPAGSAGSADSLQVSATHATLTGLMPNTDYLVSVRALCDDSVASEPQSIWIHTRCAEPLPLAENFESAPVLPACWYSLSAYTGFGSHTLLPAPFVTAGDTRYVKMYSRYLSTYSLDVAYLMLPFVDTVVNRLRLTFDYRVERFPNSVELAVGIISGDSNIDAMTVLETIRPNDTLWHTYTVETGAYSGTEGRLVLRQTTVSEHPWVSGYHYDNGHVDNVGIEVLPACDRPAAVHVEQIGSTSALVHWQDNGGIGEYHVVCDGVDHHVVGDTALLLTGLQPGTGYTVLVSTLCPDGATPYRSAAFTTACLAGPLPWHEDFEGWPTDCADPCWLNFSTGSMMESNVAGSTMSSLSGQWSLYLVASNYIVDPHPYDAVVVLPEVEIPLGEVAIGFSTRTMPGSAGNALLELGVMADAGDSSSFYVVDTVATGGTWSYYEHAFGAADSGRIALRLKAISGSARLFVDELSLFLATGCPRPQAVRADTVTQHSVTITVTDSNNVGHYRIYWQRPYIGTVDSTDVNTPTTVLFGLESGVSYLLSAAAICDSGAHLSDIVSTEFVTDCDTVTHADLPFTESFNAATLSTCWSVLPAGSNDVRLDTVHHGSSGRSLLLSYDPLDPPAFAVMPVVDTLAGLDLTFWTYRRSYDNSMLIVGVLANPTDTTTFTPVDTLSLAAGWQHQQISFDGFTDAGHHIAFRASSTDSTWFNILYLDDVSLTQALPCARPAAVVVDSVASDAVSLVIDDPGHVGRYRVQLTSSLGTSSQMVNFGPADSIYRVVVGGLNPATDYEAAVSSVCYDSSITFAVTAQFTTLCGPMALPWWCDFENEAVGSSPRCWLADGGAMRVANGTPATTGNRILYASMPDSVNAVTLSTPELGGCTDSLSIAFYVKAHQGYTDASYHFHPLATRLQVFVALDGDSVTLLADDTLTVVDEWQMRNLKTGALSAASRLVFRFWRDSLSAGGSYFYLDDFNIHCFTPELRCDSVTDLYASEIGYTQATVAWTPGGGESRWEVHLHGAGVNTTLTVDTAAVTFNGLSHNTDYVVEVRPRCSDELTGPWSEPFTFRTEGCLAVDAVTVVAVTDTSAILRWTVADDQSTWEVNYGPVGFVEGEGVMTVVDGPSVGAGWETGTVLTGLEPGTVYDVYVRAVCDGRYRSEWSARTTFTTTGTQGIVPTEENPLFTVYPNPFKESVRIKVAVGDFRPSSFVVTDLYGRRMQVQLVDEGAGEYSLDLKHLPQGSYLLTLTAGEGRQATVRLIKNGK